MSSVRVLMSSVRVLMSSVRAFVRFCQDAHEFCQGAHEFCAGAHDKTQTTGAQPCTLSRKDQEAPLTATTETMAMQELF